MPLCHLGFFLSLDSVRTRVKICDSLAIASNHSSTAHSLHDVSWQASVLRMYCLVLVVGAKAEYRRGCFHK